MAALAVRERSAIPLTVRRVLLVLLLILGLAPGLWLHEGRAPLNADTSLRFVPVARPPAADLAASLGAFELEGIWQLTSPYSRFGGYSALLTLPDGRLMAISDNARWLIFSPPGAAPGAPEVGEVSAAFGSRRRNRDTEAATRDPVTGTVWIAREDSNSISRHDGAFGSTAVTRPAAMQGWPGNGGPEAMVRLADGRFIVLAETTTSLIESRLHPAVLFRRDPLEDAEPVRFTFSGAPEFSVTDMAQLPDGRVLVLMRRLVWPFPLRFAGRIMIADPAEIRPGAVWPGVEVAKLTSSLPVDNFEGIAIEPRSDGRVTVWLISDDNYAATQRTLLWKLAVDPAHLPRARKKARG